jgi:hypothetical protein
VRPLKITSSVRRTVLPKDPRGSPWDAPPRCRGPRDHRDAWKHPPCRRGQDDSRGPAGVGRAVERAAPPPAWIPDQQHGLSRAISLRDLARHVGQTILKPRRIQNELCHRIQNKTRPFEGSADKKVEKRGQSSEIQGEVAEIHAVLSLRKPVQKSGGGAEIHRHGKGRGKRSRRRHGLGKQTGVTEWAYPSHPCSVIRAWRHPARCLTIQSVSAASKPMSRPCSLRLKPLVSQNLSRSSRNH